MMKVMKHILTQTVLWAFSSLYALSNEQQIANWLKLDEDKNGTIEQSEAKGPMQKNFRRIDQDQNGSIDREELSKLAAYLNQRMNLNKPKAKQPTQKQPEGLPEGVVVEKNIAYRDGHPRWRLDLFYPEERSQELRPGIVFVHGGGWKSGSKDGWMWQHLPARYASLGYVCISVNYRLTPDGGGYPNCVHDVKNAVRWLRAHGADYGLDPERIGAYGNSAGAHLVSMLGLVRKEAGLEGDGTHLDYSSEVQAVVTGAVPANFLDWGQPKRDGKEEFGFIAQNEPPDIEAATREASPVTHAHEEAPPFLLIHAEDDRTVPHKQSTDLEAALKAVGAEVTLLSFPDGGHGVVGAKKDETFPEMEAFFEKHLGAEGL